VILIVLLWYGDGALNSYVQVLKRDDSWRKRKIEQLSVIKKRIEQLTVLKKQKLIKKQRNGILPSTAIDPHRPSRHFPFLHRSRRVNSNNPSS